MVAKCFNCSWSGANNLTSLTTVSQDDLLEPSGVKPTIHGEVPVRVCPQCGCATYIKQEERDAA